MTTERASARPYSLARIAVALAAGLFLTAAPAAAWADTGPGADITATTDNYTTVPTVFSALESGHGDIRGLTKFEFDFESDGTYDFTSPDPVAEHTYATSGTYTVTLRVTDEFQLQSTATVQVVVADVSTIAPPQSPADGAPSLAGATLDRRTVHAGGTATLTVADLVDGEQFGARLVPKTKDDPWASQYTEVYGPFTGQKTGALTVAADVTPGVYDVLVITDSMRMTQLELTVLPPVPPESGPITSAMPAGLAPLVIAGGGLLVVAAGAAIFWVLRRKRLRTVTSGGTL